MNRRTESETMENGETLTLTASHWGADEWVATVEGRDESTVFVRMMFGEAWKAAESWWNLLDVVVPAERVI